MEIKLSIEILLILKMYILVETWYRFLIQNLLFNQNSKFMKSLNSLVFILSLFLCNAPQSTAQKDINTLYENQKYSAVITLVETNPESVQYTPYELYRIGRSYFSNEQAEQALKYFEKALVAGNDSANVYFFKGVSESELKKFERAVESLTEAIKRDSNDQYYWYQRGEAYLDLDDVDKAYEDFEHSTLCKKQFDRPYFMFFYAAYLKKNYDKCDEIFIKWRKEIDSLDNLNTMAYQILGDIERDTKKNYAKSLDYYNNIMEKNSINLKSYENLIITYSYLKDWNKCNEVFESLLNRFNEKRLQDKDLKRTAAIVDKFEFNDTTYVTIFRYFKKTTEFAEPIYKAYIDDIRTDSTVFTIQTEKHLTLMKKKIITCCAVAKEQPIIIME